MTPTLYRWQTTTGNADLDAVTSPMIPIHWNEQKSPEDVAREVLFGTDYSDAPAAMTLAEQDKPIALIPWRTHAALLEADSPGSEVLGFGYGLEDWSEHWSRFWREWKWHNGPSVSRIAWDFELDRLWNWFPDAPAGTRWPDQRNRIKAELSRYPSVQDDIAEWVHARNPEWEFAYDDDFWRAYQNIMKRHLADRMAHVSFLGGLILRTPNIDCDEYGYARTVRKTTDIHGWWQYGDDLSPLDVSNLVLYSTEKGRTATGKPLEVTEALARGLRMDWRDAVEQGKERMTAWVQADPTLTDWKFDPEWENKHLRDFEWGLAHCEALYLFGTQPVSDDGAAAILKRVG